MSDVAVPVTRYRMPPANGRRTAFLVGDRGTPSERWYAFFDAVEIGRDDGGVRDPRPGRLLVSDRTVSRSHCVITYREDGRVFVRDVSRNGTRVEGRRVVPNVEVELEPGQRVRVGDHHEFTVVFAGAGATEREPSEATVPRPSAAMVTVLVGDIRDYTLLVRDATSPEVHYSVCGIFRILADAIGRRGGTVKEFPGDAIVAFWEGTPVGEQAVDACRTALHLDRLAGQLAADRSAWHVDHFPLSLDWALATGPVAIASFGGDRPAGLSLVGEAPVLAFRLEKFATAETGRILTCRATRDRACGAFSFRDLGLMMARGCDRPDHVYALEGELPEQRTCTP